jgi:hypothetical protein
MDDCVKSCCGTSPRRTVSDLFDRGSRRSRQAPQPYRGGELRDANELTARFSIAGTEDTIANIGFQTSVCVTLIAYCELIAELANGLAFADAAQLTPRDLVAELPGVPPFKRDRAVLAIAAFRSAIAAATLRQSLDPSNSRSFHESRLHFRHAAS